MGGRLDGITAYEETSCKEAETSAEPHRIFFLLEGTQEEVHPRRLERRQLLGTSISLSET